MLPDAKHRNSLESSQIRPPRLTGSCSQGTLVRPVAPNLQLRATTSRLSDPQEVMSWTMNRTLVLQQRGTARPLLLVVSGLLDSARISGPAMTANMLKSCMPTGRESFLRSICGASVLVKKRPASTSYASRDIHDWLTCSLNHGDPSVLAFTQATPAGVITLYRERRLPCRRT